MGDLSALGPDGFGGNFYHNCWDIISDSVIDGIDTEARSSSPIVLGKFFFKIIAKIITDHLNKIASCIISHQ